MARFEVYRNPDGPGWLLDVQADVMSHLNVRMAVPLLPPDDAPLPARRLNPLFVVEGRDAVMVTQFMAAVPTRVLQGAVATLGEHRDEIVVAIDMLLSGF